MWNWQTAISSDDVHVNAAFRALLEEQCCWTCIELEREVRIAPGTIFHIIKKKDEESLRSMGSTQS